MRLVKKAYADITIPNKKGCNHMFLSNEELMNQSREDLIQILADTDDLLRMKEMTPEAIDAIKAYQTQVEMKIV